MTNQLHTGCKSSLEKLLISGLGQEIHKKSLECLITQEKVEISKDYEGYAKGLRVNLKRLLLAKDEVIYK